MTKEQIYIIGRTSSNGGGVKPEDIEPIVKEIAYEKQDGVYIEEQAIEVENGEGTNSIIIAPNNIIIGGDGETTIISKDGVENENGESVQWNTLMKLDDTYAKKQTVSANTNKLVFPRWNSDGVITGRDVSNLEGKIVFVNGTRTVLISTDNTTLNLYAPTTIGSNGQILTTDGTNIIWADAQGSDSTYYMDITNRYVDYEEHQEWNTSEFEGLEEYYTACIQENKVLPLQFFEDDYMGSGAKSYYLPSSSRIYEGNVEFWLMTTEDGVSGWQNIHFTITFEKVRTEVTSGSFA